MEKGKAHGMAVVVACCENGGIGMKEKLPWRLRGDMAFFKTLTTSCPEGLQNAVIMGRKTYFSIPEKFRPLKGRVNIVLSRNDSINLPEGVYHCKSLDDAMNVVNNKTIGIHRVFIIGGASIYQEAFNDSRLEAVYLTRVHMSTECDTFLPKISLPNFKRCHSDEFEPGVQEEGGIEYEFQLYKKWQYAQKLNYDISMVAAVCDNRGFGYKNRLPWPRLQSDVDSYLKITMATNRPEGLAVNIKGRLTHESALKMEIERPGVYNLVISSDPIRVPSLPPEQVVPCLSKALRLSIENDLVDNVFIMGGAQVFHTAMADPDCTHLILTEIEGDFPCDSYFPEFSHLFSLQREGELITENGVTYRLANVYTRKYLDLTTTS